MKIVLHRGVGLLALLALLSGIANAQDRLPDTPDDYKFGRLLIEKGFADLAVKLFVRMEQSPDTPDAEKLKAGRALLSAYQKLATEVPDPKARDRYLTLASAQVRKLVAAFEGKPLPLDLLYERGALLEIEARSAARKLEEFKDPKDIEALRKRCEGLFGEALSLFVKVQHEAKDREKVLRRNAEKHSQELQDLKQARTKAALKVPRVVRYQALLYPEDHAQRKTHLTRAVKIFDSFISQYGSDLSVLSALHARGLCYRDLGQPEKALEDFDKVVKLITSVKVSEAAGLSIECVVQWASVSTDQGNFEQALQKLQQPLDKDKTLSETELGGRLLLQKVKTLGSKAKALKKTDAGEAGKFYQEAIDLAEQLVLRGGPNAAQANDVNFKLMTESGIQPTQLGPVGKMARAEGHMRAGNLEKAIELLKGCVDERGTIEHIPIGFQARFLLGRAYANKGEHEKSLKALDEIFTMYPDRDDLPKIALERCRTLILYAKHTRDREIYARYVKALKDLADRYPDSSEGMQARFKQAESLRSRGRYLEAIEVYKLVDKRFERHQKSRFLQGLCYYKLYEQKRRLRQQTQPEAIGYLEEARQTLTWAMTEGRPAADEDWHHKAAVALCDLASLTLRHEDVLKTIDLFAKRYPHDAAARGEMLFRRLRALAALNRLDDAEKEMTLLARKGTDPGNLLRGYLTLADAYMRKADDLDIQGKSSAARKQNEKALATLKKTVQYVPPDAANVWTWLAGKFFKLTEYEPSMEAAVKAIKIYEAQPGSGKVLRLKKLLLACIKKLNRWDDSALKLLEDLEKAYPRSADLKAERAAYLQNFKKDYPQAQEKWKELVNGLKPGSSLWVKAQLERVRCFHHMKDDARAREIIRFVRGLRKDMGGPKMKAEFEVLERKLK